MSECGSKIVVTDASVLINFALVGRLDLFAQFEGVEVLVTPIVHAEVARPNLAAQVEEAMSRGWLAKIAPTYEEVARRIEIRAEHRLDPGESECLAVAAARGWWIACDEKGNRFRSAAKELIGLGRVVNTPGVVVLALRQSSLTLAEADAFIEVWRRNRYDVKFRSFVEVLEEGSTGGYVGEEVIAAIRYWTEARAATRGGWSRDATRRLIAD